MLTYETLRKIGEEERSTQKLAKLPENFFEEIKDYLIKKEKISKEIGNEWELQSAKRRLQDLLEIRERKIVTLALYSARSDIIPENLTQQEKEFFDSIVKVIKDFQVKRKQVIESVEQKKIAVAILQEIPRFVGIDLACYGPYRKTDIATLPKENAKLLIEKNMAELIEIT